MDELERSEAVAFASLYDSAPPGLVHEHGLGTVRVGGAVCGIVRALPGVRDLNRVVGADGGTDPAELLAVYDGVPHIVSEAPGSGRLAERLQASRYGPAYAWVKFARATDAGAEAPTDLRIEAVGPDRALDFAGPVAGGFGMPAFMRDVIAAIVGQPGWTCLAAYDGGRAVAGAALVVAGDQAWAGMGAVLPDARGHGLQRALLALRVRLAAEAGCTTITTETGVQEGGRPAFSYRNILRTGFEEAYVRPNWASP